MQSTPQEMQEIENRLLRGVRTVPPQAIECIPGTRTKILADLTAKIDDQDERNMLWIRGAPGSGKSSISLSTMTQLRSQGRLITYFRFDHNEASTTTSTALWRVIANDLARRFPSVRTHVLRQIQDDKVDFDSPISLFTTLIEDPLSKLTDDTLADRPLVIIIDALDECGGFNGHSSPERQALLQILGQWPKLPKQFKLLVTSRDEGDISRVLSTITTHINIPSGHFITRHPQDSASIHASNDIRFFLEYRFQRIRKRTPSLPADWPGTNTISCMADHAAGIFMWVVTATDFIDSGMNPEPRLQKILGGVSGSASMKPLYSLYTTILEISFGDMDDDDEAGILRYVLGVIVLAKRPLQDKEYMKLPTPEAVTEDMLDYIRENLRSVLAPGPDLRFVHKSFDDFLLSKECPLKYAIKVVDSRSLLTTLCLTIMTAELRFNLCSLETSCLKNDDVPDIDAKVNNGISSLLSYSCQFWADHLSLTLFDVQLMDEVKSMILDKLLYWFEAMSLLKKINQVSNSLLLLLNWMRPSPDEEFRAFIRDARQFISAFGQPIAQSAPHIYISALPFAPKQSIIAQHFLPNFLSTMAVTVGRAIDWPSPSCLFISEHHKDGVSSVAFSPDETCFLSATYNRTFCLCDPQTGTQLSPGLILSSNHYRHKKVFFSPDGRRVWEVGGGVAASWDVKTGEKRQVIRGARFIGSCLLEGGEHLVAVPISTLPVEGTVGLCDTDTGEMRVLPMPCPSYWAKLSPNGYIACADCTGTSISIWKLVDRDKVRRSSSYSQPQSEHSQRISSLSFSVESNHAVSGLYDGTILIWDAKTGGVVGQPLHTNIGQVHEVAYSHDHDILVAAGYTSLMVWNASTREAILGPLIGHSSRVTEIALSRNGRRALTASVDGTVRMWNLDNRMVTHTQKTGFSFSKVAWVTFSPCGKKVASLGGSIDGKIRLWDANTGKPLLGPIESIPGCEEIVFSPDGRYIIAFGAEYGRVGVWDAETGTPVFQQELGDPDNNLARIRFLTFRSNDQKVVTCLDPNVVRIWNLTDCTLVRDFSAPSLRSRHRKRVRILALSPDGLAVIVRDRRKNPPFYMWNTTTGRSLPISLLHEDFPPYDDLPPSRIKFSPSGQFLVTATSEGPGSRLRVWNTRTGEVAAGPFDFTNEIGNLAVSSVNECHIAFSYSKPDYGKRDKHHSTVAWVLDTRTGCLPSRVGFTACLPFKIGSMDEDNITALAFSPDGEQLLSGSWYGRVRIWGTTDLLRDSRKPDTVGGDGWYADADGKLLFWVPKDHREKLVVDGKVKVFSADGIWTEVDLAKFRYGEGWVECFTGKISGP